MKQSKTNSPVQTIRYSFPKGKKPYYVPLYGGMVYFCGTREEFAQVYDYMTTSSQGEDMAWDCLGCVAPLVNPDNAAAYIVGVFDGEMNTFVHELGHLAIEVLDRAGCPIDNHTSEAFCYLIGALAEQFTPAFCKSRDELAAADAAEAKKQARLDRKEARAQAKRDEAAESLPAEHCRKGVRRGRR